MRDDQGITIIIRNGHIIDPSQGIDGIGDISIENGKVTEIRMGANPLHSPQPLQKGGKGEPHAGGSGIHTIDATGLYVLPGLVDMHTHLREPGFEHKETIRTGTLAALRGGFTSVCCMPNTKPVNDNETVTEFILRKTYAEGACYVYPIGAITKGQKGEELAEMGMMREAGCVAFSDDGFPVMNSLIMRRALEYSRVFHVPIIAHSEDLTLSDGGVMNEGVVSAAMGLKGIPSAAEEVMISRDIALAELTGGRLHIAHVSTRGSVRLIRQAKERGIPVTAETCPHYFSLTEEAVSGYETKAKVNPPLRTRQDLDAMKEGLKDGTIDVIATDHAPHHRDEKLLEFDKATSGISGLETALSLSLRLVEEGVFTLSQLVEKMAWNPSKILNIRKGSLAAGSDADIVIVDRNKGFIVEPEWFVSKGKNSPFGGWVLKGLPVKVIVKGKISEVS
ncbi:MAG TPA: dihydroorotase [Thermodesulfovibrionales bacterium]|jgi:dihydroorotase|nr:dihydroorotase [Thermodesulfovibrionales bacterium]